MENQTSGNPTRLKTPGPKFGKGADQIGEI